MEWIHSFIILCLALTIIGKAESAGDNNDKCKTPGDQEGECISIRHCKPYVQILRRGNLTDDETKFLRQAQCGFKDGTPIVCCPSSGVASIPGRESIDDHPNWKLLNKESCGFVNDHILVGGTANLFQYPMLALLSYENSDGKSFRCSGSLINGRYVLTAAHCLQTRENVKLVSVRLGEYDLQTDPDCEDFVDQYCSDPVQDINVEEVILHPQFEFRSRVIKHDIALIRLEKPAELKESVMPVCLPTGTILSNRYEDSRMDSPGWRTGDNSSISGILFTSTQRTMSNEDCSKIYEKFNFNLGENQICVRDQSRSANCRGDSGGPLIKIEIDRIPRMYMVGIQSFGPPGCSSDIPEVYTRVAPYMQWILDTLKP